MGIINIENFNWVKGNKMKLVVRHLLKKYGEDFDKLDDFVWEATGGRVNFTAALYNGRLGSLEMMREWFEEKFGEEGQKYLSIIDKWLEEGEDLILLHTTWGYEIVEAEKFDPAEWEEEDED